MILNTQDFRDFFAYTKAMKPNNILPVYSYIKLSKGKLEKSNGQVYCKFIFDCDIDEPVLLEELEMQTFINNISTPSFELIAGDIITLASGKLKTSFANMNTADFPIFPDGTGELSKIDTRVLSIAAKYVDPKNIGWMQYPVADSNGVLGSDGFKIFYHSTPMPPMVLSIECCQIISALNDVTHYATDNTDFFFNDDVTYGFTKTSFNVPDYMPVVNKIINGTVSIKRADLLLFCDTTLPRSEKPCIIKDAGENKVILQLLDNDKNKTNELVIDVEKSETIEDFRFYPKYLASLLRPLPYETMKIHIGKNISFTTDEDSNYKGILSQLVI